MTTRDLEVLTRAGIHARPASMIAETANRYESKIEIEKENMRINAKSIMGMMTLGLDNGEDITIVANGGDEQEAIDGIEEYLTNPEKQSK